MDNFYFSLQPDCSERKPLLPGREGEGEGSPLSMCGTVMLVELDNGHKVSGLSDLGYLRLEVDLGDRGDVGRRWIVDLPGQGQHQQRRYN